MIKLLKYKVSSLTLEDGIAIGIIFTSFMLFYLAGTGI